MLNMAEKQPVVAADMVDVVIAISGNGMLPARLLWDALVQRLPALAGQARAGLLPLAGITGSPLPRRARIMMRLPLGFVAEAHQLTGCQLKAGEFELTLGELKERPLLPHATLHAQRVASNESEDKFLAGVEAAARELGVRCQWICGKHLLEDAVQGLPAGYSLVLHDLKPQDSLRLQCTGMGDARNLGCGVFIPYKEIANLD